MEAPTVVLVSHILARLVLPRDVSSSTTWFFMHALCNAALCVRALPSLALLWAGDLSSVRVGEESLDVFPILLAVELHLYHCVAFPLTWHDMFHHVFFAGVLGVPSLLYPVHATSAMLVFLSGLPGGLIYLLITARRCGFLLRVDEPLASALINLFLRSAGILTCLVQYARTLHASPATAPLPPWIVRVLQFSLSSFNAAYYTSQSVERYRRKVREAPPPRPTTKEGTGRGAW